MESFPIPAPAFDGNSRTVSPGVIFDWLRQGWALFAAYPGPWIAMTVVLIVLVLALNIVPLIGTLAAHLLTPSLAAGMLFACQKAERGEEPKIADVFEGFRRNTNSLVMLGLYYMGGMLAIFAVGAVIGGGSVVGGLSSGNAVGLGLAFGGLMVAMLLTLALSVPLFMAIWFAPALVFFNGMAPVDALKASFSACAKNGAPFLVYGLVVLVLLFFALLPVGLGVLLLVPVISASVFVAYRDIFLAN